MPATAQAAADAFGLERPTGALVPVQYSDHQTWRLSTRAGSYLVKRLSDPTSHATIRRAMALEQAAIRAGIPTATPVRPIHPDAPDSLATTVDGIGCLRVYDWLPHRKLEPHDDISDWLGDVLARLHSLEPIRPPAEPRWPDLGAWPEQQWLQWIERAGQQGKPWTAVARLRMPDIRRLTAAVQDTYAGPPDQVLTHGDLETHNVIQTEKGPVLIDWETVWPYSAALQAGRVALAFGDAEPERMRKILDAYARHGGSTKWPGERLLLSTASHEIASIAERIQAVLGKRPVPRWLDLETADRRIGDQLDELPAKLERLTGLAKLLSDQSAGRI